MNTCIDDEFASVSYMTIMDAIKMVVKCGKGAFMYKTDVKSAFRLIPLPPEQYHDIT